MASYGTTRRASSVGPRFGPLDRLVSFVEVEVFRAWDSIESAQDPEIATMSGWLKAWGQPVPSASGGHDVSSMGGSRGGDEMEGMMTEDEMAELSAATGAAFDRMWLQMMIKHDQDAVVMATTETADGQNPEAKTMAQQIMSAENREIDAMEKLLPTISG